MKIDTLAPAPGSRKKPKRIGRGMGSGHGKTATKGHKGQKARSGGHVGPAFEGGQTPIQRRLPKRGFKNMPFKKEFAIVNLDDLAKLSGIDTITPEILIEHRIVRDLKDGVKILGDGDITRPVVIKAHAFSASAVAKITAAGGKSEVL
ncbi:MAG: 50S ribosomal protein L15 [Nitrospirae bacterium]|nr:50S ribosomal protein L15 [Nitrospirota bacterium]